MTFLFFFLEGSPLLFPPATHSFSFLLSSVRCCPLFLQIRVFLSFPGFWVHELLLLYVAKESICKGACRRREREYLGFRRPRVAN